MASDRRSLQPRIKRILTAIMLLTLLVLLTSTYLCSRRTEQFFVNWQAAANRLAPQFLQVETKDYHRQLLTASALSSVRIAAMHELLFSHQIRHFAWGVKITTTLQSAPLLLAPLQQLDIITEIALDGTMTTRFELPQQRLSTGDDSLEIAGLSGDWSLETAQDQETFNFYLDRLSLRGHNHSAINLEKMTASGHTSGRETAPEHHGEIHLSTLQWINSNLTVAMLQDLQGFWQTGYNRPYHHGSFLLFLSDALFAGETFRNGTASISASGISPDLLHAFKQTLFLLGADFLQNASTLQSQPQLLELYAALSGSGMILSLNEFSLELDGHRLRGQGSLACPKTNSTPLDPLENLEINLNLDIDRDAFAAGYRLINRLMFGERAGTAAILAEQAELLVGGLLKKGLLSRKNEATYTFELFLSKGQGMVNGQPLGLN